VSESVSKSATGWLVGYAGRLLDWYRGRKLSRWVGRQIRSGANNSAATCARESIKDRQGLA
jgi:hypothetical protein